MTEPTRPSSDSESGEGGGIDRGAELARSVEGRYGPPPALKRAAVMVGRWAGRREQGMRIAPLAARIMGRWQPEGAGPFCKESDLPQPQWHRGREVAGTAARGAGCLPGARLMAKSEAGLPDNPRGPTSPAQAPQSGCVRPMAVLREAALHAAGEGVRATLTGADASGAPPARKHPDPGATSPFPAIEVSAVTRVRGGATAATQIAVPTASEAAPDGDIYRAARFAPALGKGPGRIIDHRHAGFPGGIQWAPRTGNGRGGTGGALRRLPAAGERPLAISRSAPPRKIRFDGGSAAFPSPPPDAKLAVAGTAEPKEAPQGPAGAAPVGPAQPAREPGVAAPTDPGTAKVPPMPEVSSATRPAGPSPGKAVDRAAPLPMVRLSVREPSPSGPFSLRRTQTGSGSPTSVAEAPRHGGECMVSRPFIRPAVASPTSVWEEAPAGGVLSRRHAARRWHTERPEAVSASVSTVIARSVAPQPTRQELGAKDAVAPAAVARPVKPTGEASATTEDPKGGPLGAASATGFPLARDARGGEPVARTFSIRSGHELPGGDGSSRGMPIQRQTAGRSPAGSAEQAPEPAVTAPAGPSPAEPVADSSAGADLERVADRVYAIIERRLIIEKESLGL